jgi:undecaprenyl diphosphate synthase
MVRACLERGIAYLTLFAFSSENWRRPQEEVSLLMQLFVKALEQEVEKLGRNGVRLRVVGDLSRFDPHLQELIRRAEEKTADNDRLVLTIAANYGGRWDIMQAARQLALDVQAGRLDPSQIDERQLADRLSFPDLPEPDLFIRTGGEQRLSNFVLWQSAYAELYFSGVLWPDFDAAAYGQALDDYARRQRRFGLTGDQVEQTTPTLVDSRVG